MLKILSSPIFPFPSLILSLNKNAGIVCFFESNPNLPTHIQKLFLNRVRSNVESVFPPLAKKTFGFGEIFLPPSSDYSFNIEGINSIYGKIIFPTLSSDFRNLWSRMKIKTDALVKDTLYMKAFVAKIV